MATYSVIGTERLRADPDGIARAAELLGGGRLVAFPTETVYGLGADARDGAAVARIFEAKGRPRFNPLIVHVAGLAEAEVLGVLCPLARRLAARFWPGPLTLVVPRGAGSGLSELVSAGLETVALRAPAHPAARALLGAFGGPVAAPSANLSGRVSPTTAAHVLDGLSGRIDAVLDGGPCPVGVESTVVAIEHGRVVLLRPGGVAVEAIEEMGAGEVAHPPTPTSPAPVSPGLLASHYAPGAALRLEAHAPRPGEAWLGFGPGGPDLPDRDGLTLSASGDPVEAAANLFAHLRALDAALGGRGVIAVARIPQAGLGAAINDRLRRAAAPRGTPC